MRIEILTLFPDLFQGIFGESILGRAVRDGLVTIQISNIRDFAPDKHHVTDDYPYGGGGGMIMKPEPIFGAVEHARGADERARVILMTPQGRPFSHAFASELSREEHLIFICGRYEGVDERVREFLATDEISIGDYVLTGGELPAAVVVDAVVRLIPGALGDSAATFKDSHAEGLLEYPQYTRPPVFRGHAVPDILLSGDHGRMARWRRQQAILRTHNRRPDLLARVELTDEDRKFLASLTGEAIDGSDNDA